jgi:hypothetical protein
LGTLPGKVATVQLADWHTWWKRDGARELRALLMEHWDPIGVADVSEAADEYDTYVGHVGRMLREGKPAGEISGYLRYVRTVLIGLGGWPEMDAREPEVAARITAWYEEAMRGHR